MIEYETTTNPTPLRSDILNKFYGSHGWQLVSVMSCSDGWHYVFMRAVPPPRIPNGATICEAFLTGKV